MSQQFSVEWLVEPSPAHFLLTKEDVRAVTGWPDRPPCTLSAGSR
jgi:hypothetical protein